MASIPTGDCVFRGNLFNLIRAVRLPQRHDKTRSHPVNLMRARLAARQMASAIRSFMLPVGFSLSNFSRMRDPFSGTILRKANIAVSPMHCRMSRFNPFINAEC